MNTPDLRSPAGPASRQEGGRQEGGRQEGGRWKQRSTLIRRLRVALPVVIGVIFLGLIAAVTYNALTASSAHPANSDEPIRLVNPRFVGRDDKGRAFVLIAISATRDPKEYQRVMLDKPSLVLDEGAPDAMRVSSTSGVYHEDTRKLELSGGVQLSGPKGAFQTAASLFDTKTGELVGSGPVQGSGDLGEITAKSYGVYDKGARMVFTGGVHTHIVKK